MEESRVFVDFKHNKTPKQTVALRDFTIVRTSLILVDLLFVGFLEQGESPMSSLQSQVAGFEILGAGQTFFRGLFHRAAVRVDPICHGFPSVWETRNNNEMRRRCLCEF